MKIQFNSLIHGHYLNSIRVIFLNFDGGHISSMCARVSILPLYDFSIGFGNCFDSVAFFAFRFILFTD
jgi:hypothetical protein